MKKSPRPAVPRPAGSVPQGEFDRLLLEHKRSIRESHVVSESKWRQRFRTRREETARKRILARRWVRTEALSKAKAKVGYY